MTPVLSTLVPVLHCYEPCVRVPFYRLSATFPLNRDAVPIAWAQRALCCFNAAAADAVTRTPPLPAVGRDAAVNYVQ